MTNKKLIEKILERIDYKTHTLAKIITIEDNKFKWIIPYGDTNYDFYLSGDEWEIPLDELTNRELIKLYRNL